MGVVSLLTFSLAAFKFHNCTGPAVMCCIAPHEEIKVNLWAAESDV